MDFFLRQGSSRRYSNFVDFVDGVLCTAPRVRKFILHAPWVPLIESVLGRWLEYSVRHGVEELSVSFFLRRYSMYRLPGCLFRSSTLVDLRLSVRRADFSALNSVDLPSLERLSIQFGELKNDALASLPRGCPVLQFLELKSCRDFSSVVVLTRGFREILIDSHMFECDKPPIPSILAPHVLNLRLLGGSSTKEFAVDELKSLVQAELDFYMTSPTINRTDGNLVKKLLHRLCHVTKLVIGSWCLQVLSIAEDVEDVPFLLPNCKSLTLNARMHYRDFPGIAILLAISPNLEELSINADYVDYTWATVKCDSVIGNGDEEDYCCQKLCVGLAQQLKRVEIVGLDTDCLELKWVLYLVKYLLGDAFALEKWVLKAKRRHESREKLVNPGKLLEFYQQLLCLPRASTNAELILQGVQHDEQKGK
ncbi:putative F-box/LRR-repeat protein At5g54820 [Rhodamnia argentea]|uniref:F-box/LRR-repeat protein At5g54820 n=1 Tax=Rhodamnia argentea TaxID=178133 RepID=A0ABM3H489_9MYRT|nr:putative F-box/LRR-repeat protein At5g54820 [Rhodamnia argentea]